MPGRLSHLLFSQTLDQCVLKAALLRIASPRQWLRYYSRLCVSLASLGLASPQPRVAENGSVSRTQAFWLPQGSTLGGLVSAMLIASGGAIRALPRRKISWRPSAGSALRRGFYSRMAFCGRCGLALKFSMMSKKTFCICLNESVLYTVETSTTWNRDGSSNLVQGLPSDVTAALRALSKNFL